MSGLLPSRFEVRQMKITSELGMLHRLSLFTITHLCIIGTLIPESSTGGCLLPSC